MKHSLCLVGLMTLAWGANAQAPAKRSGEQIQASFQAHKDEFDYLLGDWEFTGDSKQFGKFRGYWSALKPAEGQILDEYRVVGDDGETFFVLTTLRNFNGAQDRWELVGAAAGQGLLDFGTGKMVGAEMHIEQAFGVAIGTTHISRIRYYNIRPDGFSWVQDRSTDGGKTWVKDNSKLEARRIGPRRTLGALAPARNAPKKD